VIAEYERDEEGMFGWCGVVRIALVHLASCLGDGGDLPGAHRPPRQALTIRMPPGTAATVFIESMWPADMSGSCPMATS
jgi:hypothetical protein